MSNLDSAANVALDRRRFLALGSAALAAGAVGRAGVRGAGAEEVAEGSGRVSNPGTYEVKARGFGGEIVANVVLDGNGIVGFEVVSSMESPAVGLVALDEVPARIIAHQSTNVDGVTGATITSFAVKAMVEDALVQAGADPADFSQEAHEAYTGPAAEDVETAVVIAGAGAAGMQTAIRLARRGVPVMLVEKRELMGGTSSRAGYQLMGVGSRAQKESETVPYKTPDDMYNQYVGYDQKGIIDPEMERMRSDGIGEVMDWVRFDMGVPLDVVEPGGMAVTLNPACLAQGAKWGGYYVQQLVKELDRLGVDYRTQTRALDILLDDGGNAVGLRVESPAGVYNIHAACTVIATGAFGSNDDMVAEYLPDWVGYPSNEVPEATGDGILMAQRAGVAMSGLDEDHLVVYTACVKQTPTQTIPVGIRAAGGIVVNLEGRRFHDELDMQLINLALAAKEQPEERYFGIVDQNFVDVNGLFMNYVQADTVEELAQKLGIDPEGLADECARYSEMYDAGTDTDFNRLSIPYPVRDAPFYGCELFTGLHGFDGGILVDRRMQALREDGTPFGGLYAEGGGVDFGLATVSAMSGKAFTAKVLADTLLEDLGW